MKRTLFLANILAALFTGIAFSPCEGAYNLRGNATLDLYGKTSIYSLVVTGKNNIVKNGTLAAGSSITLQDSGELALQCNLAPPLPDIMATMQGNATLDLGNAGRNFLLTVTGTGNTLQNGSFLGTLTLAENSCLNSNSAMCSWDGPKSIVMKNGSTLNMDPGGDVWINNLSALKVEGTATINNAYLRVRSSQAKDQVYTLGNGVENLNGNGTYFVLTGDEGRDYFDLNNKTANFGIIVWESEKEADIVVRNGTIDKSVEIRGTSAGRPYSKLKLENVTIGDNASFSMGDGSHLYLGDNTIRLNQFSPASGAKAWLHSNGNLILPDGTYTTLHYAGGSNSAMAIGGNGGTIWLDGLPREIAAGSNTKILIAEGSGDVALKVTAAGKFTLGNEADSGRIITGNVDISYTGTGTDTTDQMQKDVDVFHLLRGNLKVTAPNGRVNAGIIGDKSRKGADSTGLVEAKKIYVSAFIGKELTLKATNNGGKGSAINVTANAIATDTLLFDATKDTESGDIQFGGDLIAKTITLKGNNIEGTGLDDAFLGFATCTIQAQGTVSITEDFGGDAKFDFWDWEFKDIGKLTVNAGGNIDLWGDVGISGWCALASAEITSSGGHVKMGSYAGGTLKVSADHEAVEIDDNVETSGVGQWIDGKYAVVLEGTKVAVMEGSLTADRGGIYVKSTNEDIYIGRMLSAGTSSTLDSARDITVIEGVQGGELTATAGNNLTLQGRVDIGNNAAVLTAKNGNIVSGAFSGGALTAMAGQYVTMGMITIGGNAAVLTAQGGGVSAGSFTGGSLTATAEGAVSFTGGVAASAGSITLEGGSVSVNGALAAGNGSVSVVSATGDIKIAGAMDSRMGSTLTSAGDITIATLGKEGQITAVWNVMGGSLAAEAGGSITMGSFIGDTLVMIGTSHKAGGDAVLTAKNGSIAAGAFTGATLKATATGAVTLGGSVDASGGSTWSPAGDSRKYAVVLEGTGVEVAGSLTAGGSKTYIGSTSGDITVNGALGAGLSSTLNSAGNITVGGTVGGALAASARGDVTLGAFNGETISATAGGALKITGGVAARGITLPRDSEQPAITLTGTGVSIGGSLSANWRNAFVESATGDITVDGALSAVMNATLNSAGDITVQGDVLDSSLAATAAKSIMLRNIGTVEQPAGNVALTAQDGSIAAGAVVAGVLTVSATENVQLGDVQITGNGTDIVSTGGSVKLGAFTAENARISAVNGTIEVNRVSGANNTLQAASTLQVETAVSGSGHTFLARESVTFNGSADLQSASICAPNVVWKTGATVSGLTLTGATETDSASVAVGGSLVLKDHSYVRGNVTINGMNAKVTVADSTVTGTVGGTSAIELELNSGTIGGVGNLTGLTSSGTSGITGLTGNLSLTSGLTLNGGVLSLSSQTAEGSTPGRVLISTLTVTHATRLNSDLTLSGNFPSLNLTLDAENTVTPLLTVDGAFTVSSRLAHPQITLTGTGSVEGGQRYALIALTNGQTTSPMRLNWLQVTGLGASASDFSWENGVLYYQNGSALETATWAPTASGHLWNTTDQNWTQGSHTYRYKDGVTVVFDDTAFQLAGYQGEVEMMNNGVGFMTGNVLVENSQGHNYTFKGIGKIAGTTKLTKNGSGTLTIETANEYTGGTFINGGTLVMANALALGSGSVTLGNGTGLNLGGHTLDNAVTLEGSATIGNGTLNSALTVQGGKTLTLSGNLDGEGTVTLGNTATLELGGHTLGKAVALEGSATIGNGTLNGNLAVQDGYTLTLGGNLTGTGNISLTGGATLELAGHTLSKDITLAGNGATIGSGTLSGNLVLANDVAFVWNNDSLQLTGGVVLGENASLDLNQKGITAATLTGSGASISNGSVTGSLTLGNGVSFAWTDAGLELNANITLGGNATLNLGGHALSKDITLAGNGATIGNGAVSGNLVLADGVSFALSNDSLQLTGGVVLGENSSLDLNQKGVTAATLTGSGASIGNGTIAGNLVLADGVSFTWTGTGLQLNGGIILGDTAALDLGGNSLGNAVTLEGSATIGNGTLSSNLTVQDGKTLTLGDKLTYTGAVTLEDTAALDLGGHTLDNAVSLEGSATIGNGTLIGDLTVKEGKTLTLGDKLTYTGAVTLADTAALDLGGNTFDKAVTLEGSATIRNGTLGSDLAVQGGKTLTLGGKLIHTGTVTLADTAALNLGGNSLDNAVTLEGSATIGNGSLNGALSVAAGKTLSLSGNLAGSGAISLADNAALALGGNTLDNDVTLEGSATIGGGSLNSDITVAADKTLSLSGNLAGSGTVFLADKSTLELNGNNLGNDVSLEGNDTYSLSGITIGNGTISGDLILEFGANFSWSNPELDLTGNIILSGNNSLNLGNRTFSQDIVLGSALYEINNGTIEGNLILKKDTTLILPENGLRVTGSVIMGANTFLDLGGNGIANATVNAANAFFYDGTVTGTLILGDDVKFMWNVTSLAITGNVTLGNRAGMDLCSKTISGKVNMTGDSATFGNGTLNGSLTVADGQRLTLGGNLDGSGSVILDKNAVLNLGGHSLATQSVFLKGSASIGNGALDSNLAVNKDITLTLSGGLSGSGNISLGENAALDLGGNTLGNAVILSSDAFIGNGALGSDLFVLSGKTLTLSGNLSGTGAISLAAAATLDLDGHQLGNAVTLASSASIGNGALNGTLTVEYGQTLQLSGDLTGSGAISLEDGAELDLRGHRLDNAVTLDGSATIGNGSLNSDLAVKAGQTLTLGSELDGTGTVNLEGSATLDLNCHVIYNNVSLAGNASIGNGTMLGRLVLEDGITFSWTNEDLQLNGGVTMKDGSTLNLGGRTLITDATLEGSATIGGGSLNSDLAVQDGRTLTLNANLDGTGTVSLGDKSVLKLEGNALGTAVALAGESAAIGNGTFNGGLTVQDGQTLALNANIDGTGGIALEKGATLDLGGYKLDNAVTLLNGPEVAGSAARDFTIGNGAISGDLILEDGVSYTWTEATLQLTGGVVLGAASEFNMNYHGIADATLTATSSHIINGAVTRNLILEDGVSYTWAADDELQIGGNITMGSAATLDLGGNTHSHDILLNGSGAVIRKVTVTGNLLLGDGVSYTWTNDETTLNGNFVLGSTAELDLGGNTHSRDVVLTGSGTVIRHGSIGGNIMLEEDASYTWTNDELQLGGGITLKNNAALNLGGCELGNAVALEGNHTTLGNGTLNSALSVGGGKSLSLVGNLAGTGAVSLGENAALNLGGHRLDKAVALNGKDASISNGTVNGTVSLADAASFTWADDDLNFSGDFTLGANAELNLGGHTLSRNITLNGKGTAITNGTVNGNLILTTGATYNWYADNLNVNGDAILEENTQLNLYGHSIANATLTGRIARIFGGTITGRLILGDGVNFSFSPDSLTINGGINMGDNASLDLSRGTFDKGITLNGSATIGNGTLHSDLNVKEDQTLTLGNMLTYAGRITLGDNARLNLGGCELGNEPGNEVQLLGSAYIGGGTLNSNLSVRGGKTLTLTGRLDGNGAIVLQDGAKLDLGGQAISKSPLILGNGATIGNGTLNNSLNVNSGRTLTLCGNLSGTKNITLADNAALDLGGYKLDKAVTLNGSATLGNGTLNSDVAVESGKTLHLGNALTIAGNLSGSGTISKENDGTASVTGGMGGFTGSVQVQGGELNIMGIAEAASLKVADVTIMSGTLGVYQGGTTGEENEGTLTIRNGAKLAAGHGAQLNANLMMEGGSTLDVRNTNGAGLLMGSTVTLGTGMTLNDYSADWATWKDGTKYVLFSGVDGLNIGEGMMTGTLDYTQWVDAKEYFTNIEESNRYFLCYGGAPAQNAKGILTAVNDGSNVGMVYIMTMPEPTTSTLSLLALAALAARRRRK